MSVIFKRTKILATLGPPTNNYESIEAMAKAGVNGFRLNFSHGSYEERDQQIEWIRAASAKLGKPVAILQDLQGPKIRLGNLTENVDVKTGDEIILDYAAEHNGNTYPVQYNLAEKVQVGEPIYIFDGKIRTTVIDIPSDTAITLRVENNGTLMSRKGINLPDTDFGGDILTPKDLKDVEYGATKDIDYVALSFVQSADDINNLRQILVGLGSTAQIIPKIETKAAIKDDVLEEIVKVSDGVMVARGDLAVEAGAEVVPVVQRKIIALCRKYGKLSIVATQMMASMVDAPEPTRAEVSDVANAVILGADTVMLSDETANGSYPLETVAAMKRVILYTQEHIEVAPITDILQGKKSARRAIASATVSLAEAVGASAIVAETRSGATAASIAAVRPNLPIISVTSEPRAAQQLALSYANKSFLRPDGEKAGFELAKELKKEGFFGDDDQITVAIVSGRQPGLIGGTDTIRVRVLE
ncbi:pyruvate kinase [Candidatus Saccharibacteria bacterium]|nr:pyruvate kinase [Candidatus Saccharibacteria bacterium]MBH1972390.1 pyruvate kinase [Candidatus Saccharibacteria bacterium]MBH1990268.1 pyruvate kinase [Candidatus Saccharibacteria bacterium]